MTTKVSDQRYDLEIRGQSQVKYTKELYYGKECTDLSQFSSEGVNVSHNDCIYCVMYLNFIKLCIGV